MPGRPVVVCLHDADDVLIQLGLEDPDLFLGEGGEHTSLRMLLLANTNR